MKKSMYYFVLPLVALLLGLNAYQAVNAYEMREQRTGLERAMEKAGTPAVLSISSFGDFTAFDREGNELERCSIPEEGQPVPDDVCPAFREGAEIIAKNTIEVIISTGSVCYTYYDMNHVAHVICFP